MDKAPLPAGGSKYEGGEGIRIVAHPDGSTETVASKEEEDAAKERWRAEHPN